MYPPTKEWTRFADDEEKLVFFKKWGLASKKAKEIPPVVYCAAGVQVATPCEVVGYQEHFCAVVEIKGELSCIHGSHLAETQPKFPRKSSNEKGTIQTSLDNNQELLDYAKILQDYIVLDIETTGLNKRTDRIIEIAAIHYSKGVVADTYHTLVNPEREVPSNIVALTGITQAEVDTAPVLADIADSFWQFVGDCPIVGHNIKSFDLPFLAIQLDAISENENGSWLLDSTPLYRRAFGLNRPIIDTLYLVRNRFPNLPGRKLEQLKQWLGINIAVSHRALADVETTNEVFLACYTPEKYTEQLKRAVALRETETANQPMGKSPKASKAEQLLSFKMDDQMEEAAQTVEELEQKAFDCILPELADVLQELNAKPEFLEFATLKNYSSAYLLKQSNVVFRVKLRKKSTYIFISEDYASLIPADAKTSKIKSDPWVIRVHIQKPEDILICKDAIRESLRHEILTIHTFDCCGRYEECSDALRCIHPDPKMSIGCTYKRNLAKGRVFYGKNCNNF